MSTETTENWVLIKPDGYIAVPVSTFPSLCATMKNIKEQWSSGRGDRYEISPDPLQMKLMTREQMTAMLVRDRITQSCEPDQSGLDESSAAAF